MKPNLIKLKSSNNTSVVTDSPSIPSLQQSSIRYACQKWYKPRVLKRPSEVQVGKEALDSVDKKNPSSGSTGKVVKNDAAAAIEIENQEEEPPTTTPVVAPAAEETLDIEETSGCDAEDE